MDPVLVSIALAAGGLLIRVALKVEKLDSIISRELTPNGGESLRDRVIRIDHSVSALQHDRAVDAEE